MRLYLSSYRLGDAVDRFRAMVPKENRRVAYVPNALDWSSDPERRKRSEQSEVEELEALGLGLAIERIDLRDFFGRRPELERTLREFGTVWVPGGSAFVLRQAMKLSGLDDILRELCVAGAGMLYGGYSAGICVLGPTLKGIDMMDDPSQKPYGDHETVWDGLAILDHVLVPHFASEPARNAVAVLEKEDIPFKVLRDGEVLIVEDPACR
jgi:dipeptidase E